MNSAAGQVAQSVRWTGISKAVAQGSTFATTLILVRLLSREDFGLFALALFYIGLIDMFVELGLSSAIIQRKNLNDSQLSSCFWVLAACSGLLFTASFLAAPGIMATIFSDERLIPIIQLISVVLLVIPLSATATGILSRKLRLDTIAKIELSAAIIRCVASLFLAFSGFGVMSLVYAFVGERILVALLLTLASNWRPRGCKIEDSVKSLLIFGAHITAGRLLWYVYSRLDTLVVGRLLGVEVLGVYNVAFQIANAFQQFISSVCYRIALPAFSKLQDSPELRGTVIKASRYLAIVALPVFFGIVVTAPDIVNLFLGPKWIDAVAVIQVLAIIASLQALSGLLAQSVNAVGKPSVNTRINLVSVPVFAIGFYFGASLGGLPGVLAAWIFMFPLRYLVVALATRSAVGVDLRLYLRAIAGPLIAAAVMAAIVQALLLLLQDWTPAGRLPMLVALGATAYALGAFVIFRSSARELVSMLLPRFSRVAP
ncbi:MAG: lipopolysaccharide biosynthesis protein [Gammaproteobacteria bacterium]|nr:lipopolysaccharide biosynthesis protein [Gammaproteobacteria bacterium]